jgi:hypothetical protein
MVFGYVQCRQPMVHHFARHVDVISNLHGAWASGGSLLGVPCLMEFRAECKAQTPCFSSWVENALLCSRKGKTVLVMCMSMVCSFYNGQPWGLFLCGQSMDTRILLLIAPRRCYWNYKAMIVDGFGSLLFRYGVLLLCKMSAGVKRCDRILCFIKKRL